jgi:hypothetical protein
VNAASAASSQAEQPVSDADAAAGSEPAVNEELVEEILNRKRAEREAARRLAEEDRPPLVIPSLLSLRERVQQPREETPYRIEGWQKVGQRVVMAAQFKAGKSVARDNYVRSVVDGDPWLGSAAVTPIVGRVAIIDFELNPDEAEDRLKRQGIRNDDRVILATLRGRASSFNIADPYIRSLWARWLREREIASLMLDCLRPALDAVGLNENSEARRYLDLYFAALLDEAEIAEAVVIHHMGHGQRDASGDRIAGKPRGDSGIRDWPDVEWRINRENDDPASRRFISAYGRGVNVPEGQIVLDQATNHLTLVGGTRRDVQAVEVLPRIKHWMRTKDVGEVNTGDIEDAMEKLGIPRQATRDALKLPDNGLPWRKGPRNAKLYRLGELDAAKH